jgi:hypothetical protein
MTNAARRAVVGRRRRGRWRVFEPARSESALHLEPMAGGVAEGEETGVMAVMA